MAKCLSIVGRMLVCVAISTVTSALRDTTPLPQCSQDPPPLGPWSPCGDFDNRCLCLCSIADCSGSWNYHTARGHAYIPSFSRPIETLQLSSVYLPEVPHGFFQNVSNITHLDLSANSIGIVEPDAFKPLHQLKVLAFRENHLEFDEMGPFLSLQSLEHLDLSGTLRDRPFAALLPMPEDLFVKYPLPRLQSLILDYCELETIYLERFQPLKELRLLSAVHTKTTYVHGAPMPGLEVLDLSFNKLQFAFSVCEKGDNETIYYFPRLTTLSLSGNELKSFWPQDRDPACVRHLININVPPSLFSRMTAPIYAYFSSKRFPELQQLLLTGIGPYVSLQTEKLAFSNTNLKTLILSYNMLDFSKIDNIIFARCWNITELSLKGNIFRGISEAQMQGLWSPLESLQVLHLSNSELDQISKGMFKTLSHSVIEINLNDNILTEVASGVFDDLDQLSTLRLDSNLITTISEDTFSYGTIKRLTSLNLSNNPFECSCSLLWFRKWLQSDPGLFDAHNPYSRYKCKNIPNADVTTFFLVEQQCLLSHEAYIFTLVCVAVFLVTFMAVTLLYRYRWHIRLMLYETFRASPQARWRMRRQDNFLYDLFVSYSGEDVRWVIQHLIPVLEQQMGLRLCVHQRDFLPGNNITDNIVESLAASKRVLALFTPRFAESQWCHFELQMCLNHVIENDDVMVVVILEHVPSRDMTGAMIALMKTTTYIEWGEEPEAVESFWR